MASDPSTVELDLPSKVIAIPNPIPCDPLHLSIPWPGGFTLKPFLAAETAFTDCNQIERLMLQLQATLAGIMPMFLISDVILKILACMQSIPEAITSLSPKPITDCLSELIAAIIALICATYPPYAWVAMIIAIVQFIVSALTCVRTNMKALCDGITRLENLEALIENQLQPELNDILAQTKTNIQCQQTSLVSGLQAIMDILTFINTIIQIVNDLSPNKDNDGNTVPLLPQIPVPSFAPTTPCEDIVSALDDLIDALKAFTGVIPDCTNPV